MGRRKLTTEEFINRVKQVHGDKYDYSLVEYTGVHNKIKIICSVHGVFKQKSSHHLNGCGCPKCGTIKTSISTTKTTEEFINRVKQVHGDKYDYSLVEYINNKTKVKIICPIHGIFEQIPYSHLNGCGCPKCGTIKTSISTTKTTEEFIKDVKEVHGDKYDYSLVEYINIKTKVKIICPIHGIFEQIPYSHLKGSGCSSCFYEMKVSKQELSLRSFISSIYKDKIITNDRDIIQPYELDIFLPDINIAFEYNGDYWHCNPRYYESLYYHDIMNMSAEEIWEKDNIKKNMCNTKDINLISIWEDKWMNDRKNTKQFIKSIIK